MTNWVTAQWLHQLHLAGVIKSNLRGEGGHGLPADKHPEEGRTPGLTAAENSEPAANRDETANNPERGMLYLKMKKKKKSGEDCILHKCQCHKRQRQTMEMFQITGGWGDMWQPTPVFLPGKFHGQKSLAGYSPWAQTRLSTHTHRHDNEMWYVFSDWILRWQENVRYRAS